jgi:hypothetical protein
MCLSHKFIPLTKRKWHEHLKSEPENTHSLNYYYNIPFPDTHVRCSKCTKYYLKGYTFNRHGCEQPPYPIAQIPNIETCTIYNLSKEEKMKALIENQVAIKLQTHATEFKMNMAQQFELIKPKSPNSDVLPLRDKHNDVYHPLYEQTAYNEI